MYERIRRHASPTALTLSVLAVVLALAGGAIAAGGLTGKQKKEVEKIAKKSGKPGPEGKQGSAGTPGAAGKDGANGTNGTNGKDGANGTNGAEGEEGPEGPEGPEGLEGLEGPEGPEGPSGPTCQANGVCALPVGATMTGVWSFRVSNVVRAYVPISYPLRYDNSGESATAIFVTRSEQDSGGTAECPSNTYETPKAEPGYLCIYESRALNNAEPPFPALAGDPSSGTLLASNLIDTSKEAEGAGTWAVTR